MVGSTATAVGADGIWAVVVDKEGGNGGGAAATSRHEMHELSKDMLNDGASATVIASATQRVSMWCRTSPSRRGEVEQSGSSLH